MATEVLITDDEVHVITVVTMKLEKAGYTVRSARNGAEALDACRQRLPDLLITDCRMPVMDGLELCQQIQDDEVLNGLPRIMLTSREFEITDDQKAQRGIRRVLPKPFSARDLLAAVQETIGPASADASDIPPAKQQEAAPSRDASACESPRVGEADEITQRLSQTYEELALVYRVSSAMSVKTDLAAFLGELCEGLREVSGAEAVIALAHARNPRESDSVICTGPVDVNLDQAQLLGTTLRADVEQARGGVLIANNFHAPPGSGLDNAANRLMASLLRCDEDVRGMVFCLNRQDEFDTIDSKLLASVAAQAGAFLTNQALYADLEDLLISTLHALTAAIDAKDAYTCGHSDRVARLSRMIGEKLGLGEERLERIHLAGLLHDIGKIGVDTQVLRKTSRLDDDEFKQIKGHPAIGYRILCGIRQLSDVLDGVVAHHEKFDGRGYPKGLAGQDIPLVARIIGLADTFDAMTSNRAYRDALPMDTVREEFRKCSGTQFDPELVDAFLSMDLDAVHRELHSRKGQEWAMPDLQAPEKRESTEQITPRGVEA